MVRLYFLTSWLMFTIPQAAQQTQGIQTLLEAEKEAAKVVQQARQRTSLWLYLSLLALALMSCGMSSDRVQRLKDARTEASKEVEEYKRQKEQEYKAFESKVIVIGFGLSLHKYSSHIFVSYFST